MKPTTPVRSNNQHQGNDRRATQTARSSAEDENFRSCFARTADWEASCGSWRVVNASPGDHPLIHQFLVSVFRRPSPAEFQAQLEEPSYEPRDRLLIRDEGRIAGHVRLINRDMRFGDLVLPVGMITDLATRPEYQGQGCASALLSAACQTLVQDGAVLALLATNQPHFYARRGWVVNGRHCYSASAPRKILSYLKQREAEVNGLLDPLPPPHAHKQYNIRLWRHVERAPVMRLYEERTQAGYGSLVRPEAYWRWLLSRWGKQRIYIAIDGPDRLDMDQSLAPIVAYAAARDGRIVELMSSDAHPEAGVQLLARACQDAIEQDFCRVRLDAPPGEPLHPVMVRAGGEHQHAEADQGMV
ncbi:MAG: GNAT family N-acetyltransferase, partial [Planctomycetota bacterium]